MSLRDELNEASVVEELQTALKKAQNKLAKREEDREALVLAVYKAARDAALALKTPKPILPKKDRRTKKAEVALIHATDWQLGKKTVSYDVATCDRRMEQLAEKVIRITNIQRADHPVREAVLLLGGDMVENVDLFPGQAFEIEAHLYDQLFETVRIIEKLVRTLSANFEKVRVVCEYGNHGRIGKYGVNPKGDNIDRMSYRIAADRTASIPNVSWQMSDAGHQIFEIGNYRGLLVHGDEIRSFGGTPIFAIVKRFTSWSSGVMPDFHEGFMGHYHVPLSLTLPNSARVYVTGSPESGSVYATETIGALGKPSQRLHFIDPEKAITTAEFVLWLD
jgi:hypothetical protein